MQNFVKEGKTMVLDVAGATAAGAGVLNSHLFGVAITATTGAGTVECQTEGVVTLPKPGGTGVAFVRGARCFWNGTAVDDVLEDQLCIGVAAEAAADAATTVNVKLGPVPVILDAV